MGSLSRYGLSCPVMLRGITREALEKQAYAAQGFFIFMTSEERRRLRYERRKHKRTTKRKNKLSIYDDFNRLIDFDNLYSAFKACKRGVSWKESVQCYEANAMRNIADTQRKLLAGQSVQSGFMEFTLNERGKQRHIKSVHISERVVQKCLCDNVLVPILSNTLIHDNGASIKGKGVSFALRRLITHLRRFYRANENSNDGYALIIDFKKFFDSIDHAVLFNQLDTKIKDTRLRKITKQFISVFGEGKSLGLGSQVSQISAIFYPDKLDHFIKEKLRIKYYEHYMDDMYLLDTSKYHLEYCLNRIKEVCAELKITVNNKKTRIVKLQDGVSFLKGKYKLLASGKILRLPHKDSAKRMRRKLKKFKRLLDAGKMNYRDISQAYQSWRGNYLRRFNDYGRIILMDKLYNDLFIYDWRNKNDLSCKEKRRGNSAHKP